MPRPNRPTASYYRFVRLWGRVNGQKFQDTDESGNNELFYSFSSQSGMHRCLYKIQGIPAELEPLQNLANLPKIPGVSRLGPNNFVAWSGWRETSAIRLAGLRPRTAALLGTLYLSFGRSEWWLVWRWERWLTYRCNWHSSYQLRYSNSQYGSWGQPQYIFNEFSSCFTNWRKGTRFQVVTQFGSRAQPSMWRFSPCHPLCVANS